MVIFEIKETKIEQFSGLNKSIIIKGGGSTSSLSHFLTLYGWASS